MQKMNQRIEQVERWANYVRSHKDWKRIHTDFINAQFVKYSGFLKRIIKTPDGRNKLKLLVR